MPVTAPPSRPRPRELDEIERIEALIEEARRRARRRRWRNSALAVVLVVGGLIALSRGGGDKPVANPERASVDALHPTALDRSALAAGGITLIGLPLDAAGANPGVEGWYELSMLDGRSQLRPLLRCPNGRSYCGLIESIDWSPDGRRLAFTVGAHGALNPFVGLHVLDAVTGVDQHVLDSDVCGLIMRSDVAWSPDGSRLAYVCDRALGPGRAVVIFEPGRGVRELPTGIPGRVSSPTWSPQGGRIAFARHVAGARPAVVLMRLDGSQPFVLATDATAPDWSPDGRTIAYRAGCGGIKLVTPQGRDVTPVGGVSPCRAIGVSGTPVWSPDGERLAISNRSGVYLVERDGSRLRRLTKHTGIGHHGGRPAWRPGG